MHGTTCNRPPKCSNCQMYHPAVSKDCFYFKLETEIFQLQYREKFSSWEAKKKATESLTNCKSYASITKTPLVNKIPPWKTNKTTIEQPNMTNALSTQENDIQQSTSIDISHIRGKKWLLPLILFFAQPIQEPELPNLDDYYPPSLILIDR